MKSYHHNISTSQHQITTSNLNISTPQHLNITTSQHQISTPQHLTTKNSGKVDVTSTLPLSLK
ncbi:MAG: hypothetical protein MSA97_03180 [Prevotella sp.]|nr:hypothetical protein [Prevotella sp.]